MLQIDGLSKRYDNGVQALDDASLTIPSGMFGLLGPNGAGKSTLMRTLATLQEADAGSANLGDLDVLRDKDAVRRVLGYLPQEFGLYPKVSAHTLLDHFAVLKGLADPAQRRARVDALLKQTNLWDARNRKLGTYSGGMKQRFGIAVALLGSPRLVIVDEPTAGLDPEERVRFHNLLAEIGEDVVVILSTHIVDDVADLCKHMAIIHRGRVVSTGEPAQLVAAMRGQVWARRVDKDELAALMRASAGGHAPPERAGGSGDQRSAATKFPETIDVLSTRRFAGQTIARVRATEQPGEGFTSVEADLEDVYFGAIHSAASAAGHSANAS